MAQAGPLYTTTATVVAREQNVISVAFGRRRKPADRPPMPPTAARALGCLLYRVA